MSNNNLPQPDISAGPKGGDGEVASAETVVDRRRSFLTEEANLRSGTQRLVDTITHLEAAMREPPKDMSAALSRGLADLAVAIEQIEEVLRPKRGAVPDAHVAVEHIQDTAMTLRQRDVDSALCDTLEAATRDVGDAIVRSDTAAAHALSVAIMLRGLVSRIKDNAAPIPSGPAFPPEAVDEAVAVDPTGDRGQVDTLLHDPLAYSAAALAGNALVYEEDPVVSLAQSVSAPSSLPDKEAAPRPKEDQADIFNPIPPTILMSLQNGKEVASMNEPDAVASAVAASDLTEGGPRTVTALLRASIELSASPPALLHVSPNDPLAALYALSEEELIALFS